jgi:urate oxidase
MEQFASGWKRNYYGKGAVSAYRLHRDGAVPAGRAAVFGAEVLLLIYGDSFWPTYTTGDNTGLVATDSMKNFIQRETANFDGFDLEEYCRFLGRSFLAKYPQAEGAQVTAEEIPFARIDGGAAYEPDGPERSFARLEMTPAGIVDVVSGLRGFRLLRLGGSAFHGFVRDEYTTLPDLHDRPLHMWLDLELHYASGDAPFSQGAVLRRARAIVRDVFRTFESGSIQQVIYQMGARMLDELPAVNEVHLEAQNRTWDTVVERDRLGVYSDPRPPYGCLGLRLTR